MADVETKAPALETKPAAEIKPVEKQTNCLSCNKPLKKLRSYYRNGKFYCTKKCWLKTRKPSPAKDEKK